MTSPSEYVVTARKWRPQQFGEVVGQDHVTTTLRNALASGRIHHAYLFCGPRGVGKTTTARIVARAVNCAAPRDGIEPCNECDSCRDIISGRSMDVVEIDGASNNSVEDIRRLRENAKYPPTFGRYKVYIIDEVHMLSSSAFNALLKTLEEPPAHLLFIFATTEPHKVPATIQSRCQRFDFHRMSTRTIAEHLRTIADAEQVAIDDDALFAIARFADGSMRDAQSLFDQVRAFASGPITGADVRRSLHVLGDDVYFAITDAIAERSLARAFELARTIVGQGFDIHQAIVGLLEHLRNVLTVRATGSTELIEASDETRQQYSELAQRFTQEDLVHMMTITAHAEQHLRFASQPQIRLELLLAQLVHLPTAYDIGRLIAELEQLRSQPPEPPQAPTAPALPQRDDTAVSPQPANAPKAESPSQIGAATAQLDWQAFIATLPPTLKILKPILARIPPPTLSEHQCTFSCSDTGDAKMLEEKRQTLETYLAKKLGRSVAIQIVQSASAAAPSPAPPDRPAAVTRHELFPIERALIEKFGAQRVAGVR